MKKEERFFERIVLLLLLAGAAFLYYTAGLSKSVATGADMASMDFPKGILLVLMVFCAGKLMAGLAAQLKQNGGRTTPAQADQPAPEPQAADFSSTGKRDPRTVLTMAAIVIYALFWRILGFCISSFLFFFAESILLKRDTPRLRAVLISAFVTLAIYVIFGMAFGVDFPEPLLELVIG